MSIFIRRRITPALQIFQKMMPLRQGLILCYHGIEKGEVSPLSMEVEDFRRQMEILAEEGYRSVTLAEVVDHLEKGRPLPPKSVCLTFDDGYRNNYELAFPLLKELGFRATIFLPTDFMDQTNRWILENRNPEYDSQIPQMPLMSWEEVKEMNRAGFVFDSHSCSHADFTKLTIREMRRELEKSREIIEGHTGERVDFFCYPYGFLDLQVADMVRAAGYRGAVTLQPGVNRAGQNPYFLKRCSLYSHSFDTMLNFALYTSVLCGPAMELKRWGESGLSS